MSVITATQEEFVALETQSQANHDAINAAETGILARLTALETLAATVSGHTTTIGQHTTAINGINFSIATLNGKVTNIPASESAVDDTNTFTPEAATVVPAGGGNPAHHFSVTEGEGEEAVTRYFNFNSKKVVIPGTSPVQAITAKAAQGGSYASLREELVEDESGQITEVFPEE